MPTISVIVPVYNCTHLLGRCIDSILGQSFRDFELLVVDDGSTDGTESVCDSYPSVDNRVIVVHKQNGGVSAARNAGLAMAKGQYICFADADDYVEPNWLSDLFEAVQCHPTSLVSCNIDIQEPDRRYLRYNDFFGEMSLQGYLGVGDWGHPWNKIYRKDVIESLSLTFDVSMKVHEDETFVAQYASACNSAFICERVGYHYLETVSLSDKYSRYLTVENTYHEYYSIKKYSQLCSCYLVDRLMMEVYDTIKRSPSDIKSIVERFKNAVGKDISYVNGGRKFLFRMLKHTDSSLVWTGVFKICLLLDLI